jgi:hypothetical protein
MKRMLLAGSLLLLLLSVSAHAEEQKIVVCQGTVEWMDNEYLDSEQIYFTIHGCPDFYDARTSHTGEYVLDICPIGSRCYVKIVATDYQEEMVVDCILRVMRLD